MKCVAFPPFLQRLQHFGALILFKSHFVIYRLLFAKVELGKKMTRA